MSTGRVCVCVCLSLLLGDVARAATFTAVPFEFDPDGTNIIAARWKTGLGCPSSGVLPAAVTMAPVTVSESGCPTTDSRDKHNEGLLVAKSGPTAVNGSAGVTIQGVKGITLTELGYDLRKVDSFADDRGSHCGAGAPRFNVVTQDGVTHFIGCQNPVPIQTATGSWIRLRYAPSTALPAITSKVKSISIVFDEGTDTGPDFFGAAVLDNIDINGTLIGRGPDGPEQGDRDEGHGGDNDHHWSFNNSASRPETSSMSYEDHVQGTKIEMISPARSIAYSGTCVSFVGDAMLDYEPGYVLTFAACDLSALSTPLVPQIGNFTVTLTGAQGVVYQTSGPLTYGVVTIHQP